MILKSIFEVLSPGGQQGRLSILIFHRVLSRQDPLFPGEQDVRRFDKVLSWVARWFQVIPLDLAASQLRDGTLPARCAAITFDDGYADNASNALPVLQRHGMTATFFVATSFLDGGRMWNDSVIESLRCFQGEVLNLDDKGLGSYQIESPIKRRAAIDALLGKIKYMEPVRRQESVRYIENVVNRALPDDLMMSCEQVKLLRRSGMGIGAHTLSHPILARISDAEAVREISDSKTVLETLLQEPVSLFAYPNGKPGKDYLAKHALMVRDAGFAAAVSTAPGVSSVATDRFQMPRFSPWDTRRLRYGLRMLSNLRTVEPQIA